MGGGKGLRRFAARKKTLAFAFLNWAAHAVLLRYLQPNPNVDIATGDLGRAKEDMSTETTSTVDPDGILAAVRLGGIEGDFTALVAVGSVGGPCCSVQSALEALSYLSKGRGDESESEKGDLAEHCRG